MPKPVPYLNTNMLAAGVGVSAGHICDLLREKGHFCGIVPARIKGPRSHLMWPANAIKRALAWREKQEQLAAERRILHRQLWKTRDSAERRAATIKRREDRQYFIEKSRHDALHNFTAANTPLSTLKGLK